MHDPALTNTILRLKAKRLAAETFGRKPAPQGESGPGLHGESGGMKPLLGRRPVSGGYREQTH